MATEALATPTTCTPPNCSDGHSVAGHPVHALAGYGISGARSPRWTSRGSMRRCYRQLRPRLSFANSGGACSTCAAPMPGSISSGPPLLVRSDLHVADVNSNLPGPLVSSQVRLTVRHGEWSWRSGVWRSERRPRTRSDVGSPGAAIDPNGSALVRRHLSGAGEGPTSGPRGAWFRELPKLATNYEDTLVVALGWSDLHAAAGTQPVSWCRR